MDISLTLSRIVLAVFLGISVSAAKPVVSLQKTEYDLGDFEPYERIAFDLDIKNAGDEPLLVHDIKASCSCARLSDPTLVIKANNSASIRIKIQAPGNESSGEVFIYFATNSDDLISGRVTIKYRVKSRVRFTSEKIIITKSGKEDAPQVIEIKGECVEKGVIVKDVIYEYDRKFFKIEKSRRNLLEFTVETLPNFPAGQIVSKVKLCIVTSSGVVNKVFDVAGLRYENSWTSPDYVILSYSENSERPISVNSTIKKIYVNDNELDDVTLGFNHQSSQYFLSCKTAKVDISHKMGSVLIESDTSVRPISIPVYLIP